MTLEELKAVNRYAESTKSLSYLPQVSNKKLIIKYVVDKLSKKSICIKQSFDHS